jgi:hypothetical protein
VVGYSLSINGVREIMPALPNVAKVLRLDFFFTVFPNTRVRDRVYFNYAGAGPSIADLTNWLTTVGTGWSGNLAARQQTGTTLTQVEATDLTSATGAQSIKSLAVVGTDAGGAPALGTAAVIRFKIQRRYRGGHPRFYFPGVSTAHLGSANAWDSTYVTNLAASWLSFVTAVITAPPAGLGAMQHVNISYFAGFTNKPFPSGRTHPVPTLRGVPVQDQVLSYSVNPIIGSQRRRYQQSA